MDDNTPDDVIYEKLRGDINLWNKSNTDEIGSYLNEFRNEERVTIITVNKIVLNLALNQSYRDRNRIAVIVLPQSLEESIDIQE